MKARLSGKKKVTTRLKCSFTIINCAYLLCLKYQFGSVNVNKLLVIFFAICFIFTETNDKVKKRGRKELQSKASEVQFVL